MITAANYIKLVVKRIKRRALATLGNVLFFCIKKKYLKDS